MPLAVADLVTNRNYFICQPTVVLHADKTGGGALNHLLLGDWLRWLGETNQHGSKTFAKVKCRGDTGWLELGEFDVERGLEVNFVDVGQGDGCHIVTPDDEIVLIDAGVSDNMNRFLSWRYNLRGRNVAGTEDFDASKPDQGRWSIDHVVISHPDNDHYFGFGAVFANPKLAVGKAWHNGIVERPDEPAVPGVSYPSGWDLGGHFAVGSEKYLFDYITGDAELKAMSARHPATTKQLLSTFRKLIAANPACTIEGVGTDQVSLGQPVFLPGFEAAQKFSLQVLGPVRETVSFQGQLRQSLRVLGDEGETKNGHSVVLKGQYGKLKLLLGGDLNEPAQNFLLRVYAGTPNTPAKVRAALTALDAKPQPLATADQQSRDALAAQLVALETQGRAVFGVDVAKACHHGSQHIVDDFLRATDAVATVLSSGDNEPHSHPRPDALGAYGKHSHGSRPLIFSTELARSTNEFSPYVTNYITLLAEIAAIEAETDAAKKEKLVAAIEAKKDRNVAVYGMITLRALGDKVIIAQKLEVERKPSQKWDWYELHFDEDAGRFLVAGH